MYKHDQGIPMKIGNNRPLHGSVLAGVVGVLLLAGCQRESEPAPVTDAAPAAEATAAGETPATEAPLDLRDEHKRPRHLQIECRIPVEEVPPLLAMNDRQLGHFEPILNAHRRLTRT